MYIRQKNSLKQFILLILCLILKYNCLNPSCIWNAVINN